MKKTINEINKCNELTNEQIKKIIDKLDIDIDMKINKDNKKKIN